MDKKLENVVKLIAPIGTLFVLFGLLVANFYYAAFNIDIFPYIEFGEAIMLFLSQIIPLLTIFAIMGILLFFYFNEAPDGINNPGKIKGLIVISMIIPIFFIFIDLFVTRKLRNYKYLDLTWNIYWFPFIKIVYIFVSTRLALMKNYKILLAFYAIGIFVIGLIFTSEFQVVNAVTNMNKQIVLTLKDGTKIKSDSTFLFLGRTKNYFIFFNTSNKESTFTPSDLIDQIILKN